jgi:hypothetical protein
MSAGLYIPLAVALVILIVGYSIAFSRKGKVGSTTIGKRRTVLHSSASPRQTLEALTQQPLSGYQTHDVGPLGAVFATSPSFFSWGFLFPVDVTAVPDGSRIDIGIRTRLYQYGPLVTRAHEKFAEAVATQTGAQITPN